MSDGFVEAKGVYVALLNVCIACLVLSSGNRKEMLKRTPSRANRIKLSIELSSLTGFYSVVGVRFSYYGAARECRMPSYVERMLQRSQIANSGCRSGSIMVGMLL